MLSTRLIHKFKIAFISYFAAVWILSILALLLLLLIEVQVMVNNYAELVAVFG